MDTTEKSLESASDSERNFMYRTITESRKQPSYKTNNFQFVWFNFVPAFDFYICFYTLRRHL